MPTDEGSTVRRRRLGMELRRLRIEAGLTGVEVAARLSMVSSTISRMETGRIGRVNVSVVRAMLDVCGVTDPTLRDAVIELAKDSRKKGWWQSYADVLALEEGLQPLFGFEASADTMRIRQIELVNGLFQTEDYARALIVDVYPDIGTAELDRRIAVRMNRQRLLTEDSPPRISVVLDETALRRTFGGLHVMRRQLDHLAELANLSTVNLQVLPLRSREHPAADIPFTILTFPDDADPDIVYLEHLTGSLYVEEQEDVARYIRAFGRLEKLACGPADSAALVGSIAKELP